MTWQASGKSIQMSLSELLDVHSKSGMIFGSAKIRANLRSGPKGPDFMLLAFDSGRDKVIEQLRLVLKMKAWIGTADTSATGTPAEHDNTVADSAPSFKPRGIAGLERQSNVRAFQQAQLTDNGFSDLDKLMTMAKPMVELAQRMEAKLSAHRETATEDELELAQLLQTVGIHNPVTKGKNQKERDFHEALARELATNMCGPLEASRGMLPLTDVYCIHSRMRGTQLVAPSELRAACELLGPLGLGVQLRSFESGVVVLSADSRTDDAMCADLEGLVTASTVGFVTALEVAQGLDISMILASEYIKIGEARGLLCRDQSFEATRFYPNRFCAI